MWPIEIELKKIKLKKNYPMCLSRMISIGYFSHNNIYKSLDEFLFSCGLGIIVTPINKADKLLGHEVMLIYKKDNIFDKEESKEIIVPNYSKLKKLEVAYRRGYETVLGKIEDILPYKY